MKKFLDLTYYKKRDFIFPHFLDPNLIKYKPGIQSHYIELTHSGYGKKLFEKFYQENDLEMIEKLVSEHGVFFEKFVERNLRQRIHLFFHNEEESEDIIESCMGYYKIEERRRSVIDRIKYDFYKVSLIRLKNQYIYNELKNSEKKKSEVKKCPVCGKKFRPINLPDWVYYGSYGNDIICFECPINENPDKESLKQLIPQLVDKCNFIPNSDFNPINYNFSSRVKRSNWTAICQIIFEMGISGNDTLHSDSIFKNKFGSWFKALVISDILPNGILETSRGFRCIANSGNECNSLDEMYIDNWLFERNIIADKEPYYPKHPIYNKSGRRRADWKVEDFFIEYFGLKGEENYDKKTLEKLKLVEDFNLNLISIFPSDLNNISRKLNILRT
jgi:hypothetical protein